LYYLAPPPAPHALPSFPTRRSSDLELIGADRLAHPQSRARKVLSQEVIREIAHAELGAVGERPLHFTALGERDGGMKLMRPPPQDRKSTRLNSSHVKISYAVFCLKK